MFTDSLLENDYKKFENEFKLKIYFDKDEETEWFDNKKVLHIELRKWADIMLIAPLSANTLAKIVHGICDNLLTCVVRAWDFKKPVLFALAMNTFMYEHFLTIEQKNILIEKFKFFEIPTQVKKLACGDYGDGALASPETIYNKLIEFK